MSKKNEISQIDKVLKKKDKKIIKKLNENSRQSFSQIGRKIGLSKSTINYRINKMKDEGIITLFCTTINRSKLGYKYCRLFLKFQHFTEELRRELIDFISELDNIHWVASLDGFFDFCIIFLGKTLKKIGKTYDSIVYEFDEHIIEKEMSIATYLYYLPYNYLYDDMKYEVGKVEPVEETVELDEKSYELINIIKENSRKPTVELMEELDVSAQTIKNRMKKLKENNIITGFNIRVDHTKFGLHHFHTFLNLTNMDEKMERKLIQYLTSKKTTTHIIKAFGRWDLEFESVFKSHFELHDFLKKLKDEFPENISKHNSALIYKIYPINTVEYG